MTLFSGDGLRKILEGREPPCISLYQPTHRRHPENQQDPIRYRNLLREIEASLLRQYPTRDAHPLLDPFQALVGEEPFWNHRTDGLAILASGDGYFGQFDLQRPVPELAVVADSFHVKPLLRIVQSADRYQILRLDRHSARLYEGNRDVLDEVELVNVPSTITAALGDELTEPFQNLSSHRSGAAGPAAIYHGHGSRKDEIDKDMERFFRVVDRGVLEHHSRPSGLPLMLAALSEYHTPFRNISHNPFLIPEGIPLNTDALTPDELRAEAWRVMEPRYLERLAGLVDAYHVARARRLASEDLQAIGAAAGAGRVATLLVEAGRQVPGHILPDSAGIRFGDLADPDTDDVLDDLAELTIRRQGEVVLVPAERMPTRSGAAAIYRF